MDLLGLNTIGILVALIVVVYTYVKWSSQYWKRRNVPYLEPNIPYGNLDPPRKKTVSIGEEVARIYHEGKQKGWKYFGMYFYMRPTFMIVDPDLVKQIMTKDFNNFVDRGMYVNEKDEPISAHLFSIGGIKWKNLRAKLTPTFTSGKLRIMFQTLTDCGIALENFIDDSLKQDKNEPLDVKNVLACYTTDIIGSCAFGLDCNSFKEPNSPFRRYGNKIFEERTRLGQIKSVISQTYPELAKKLHIKTFPDDVTEFFTDVVKRTVNYRENNNVERKDFLQMLIDMKNNKDSAASGQQGDGTSLTMDEMIAQCFVFFFGGFETSSTTMSFTLFELALHQEIQDKVREEIRRVLRNHNDKINYDSLKELKYMDQVLDETLRKYPPIPFVTRENSANYRIPDSDIVIEKGTRVFIPIRGLHYDEEYYPDPEKFDPERFTEENKQSRHQYVHIPFGEGPRTCIGMRFGLMQSKVGLASVLKNHRVTLNERTKVPLEFIKNNFVPSTKGAIWLNFEKV